MREIRSLFRNLMCWTWIASGIAIPGMLNRAAAQVVTQTQVQVIGPAMANPGEQILFCFQSIQFNFQSQAVDVGHSLSKEKPATATLRILDGVNGQEKAKKSVTFPVSGSPALPSDPCLLYPIPLTAAAAPTATTAAIAASPSIYIGVVSFDISAQPLPPGAAPSASFDIFTPIFGFPAIVRHIHKDWVCLPADPCAF